MEKYKTDQWNLKWLKSKSVRYIWRLLSKSGAQVYFVGGCVRDSATGRQIKDIDIATDALPSRVVDLAQSEGLKVIKSGYSHGSVSIIVKKKCFEITTFRSDLISDGRYSKVRFSSNILEDAKRRDFTMNALYMTIDGKILDPIGGWEDLVKGNVRFIGKPEQRIEEDYLRVLRYFRFLANYGKNINPPEHEITNAFSNALLGLRRLTKERVWTEVKKILLAKNPYFSMKVMDDCGVLMEVLPSANIENLKQFLKIEEKLKLKLNVVNRLVALSIHHALIWARALPLRKSERYWLSQLLINFQDSSPLRVKGYKYEINVVIAALAIEKSNMGGRLIKRELEEIKFGSSKCFPVNISDLLKFFSPSKELGMELERLKDIWFVSNLEYDREYLLKELQKHNSH